VTTATAIGAQRRTLTDNKASSEVRSSMVADAFGFPDKEEVSSSTAAAAKVTDNT